jgi:hypothetical protein
VSTEVGELRACRLTGANVDARVPVPALGAKGQGTVFGGRGSIPPALFATLFAHGVQLLPQLRKELKNQRRPLMDDR